MERKMRKNINCIKNKFTAKWLGLGKARRL